MNLLAIDTSTEYLSVAVMRGGKIAARSHRRAPMMHSKLLVPEIAKLLDMARLGLRGLDGFCVSVGPGSFTGLRIGVTVIKAMAYASGKPVAAVPTLDAIAENARRHRGIICPALDARKGKVYACIYESDGNKPVRVSRYLLAPAAEIAGMLEPYDNVLMLGDGVKFFGGRGESAPDWHPRADTVAMLGAGLLGKGKALGADDLEPMYLYSRECDIVGK